MSIILPPVLTLNFSHFLMSIALNLLYIERGKGEIRGKKLKSFFNYLISLATEFISTSIEIPGNV